MAFAGVASAGVTFAGVASAGEASAGTAAIGAVDAAWGAESLLVRRVISTAKARLGACLAVDTTYPEEKAAVAMA